MNAQFHQTPRFQFNMHSPEPFILVHIYLPKLAKMPLVVIHLGISPNFLNQNKLFENKKNKSHAHMIRENNNKF
jgi:hypothetical protein